MKLKIYNKDASSKGEVELPSQFFEPVRHDLIKRAVVALKAASRTPYGSKPVAGMRHSSDLSKRRRAYRGSYGSGQSRTDRKILSRNGSRMYFVGATVPFTVGGRRAHPPKAYKVWTKKVNVKENKKAIRSALAATIVRDEVMSKGHIIPKSYPFAISDDVAAINKASDAVKALSGLGFDSELKRVAKRKIRAGKGKARGRKYKTRKGILLVVGPGQDVGMGFNNVTGVNLADVSSLNAEILAPGYKGGRAALFTESALQFMKDTKIYLPNAGVKGDDK